MLVLSRKAGERVIVGGGITVTLVEVKGGRIRLGIEAPNDVVILRGELADQMVGEDPSDADLRQKPDWSDAAAATGGAQPTRRGLGSKRRRVCPLGSTERRKR